jgi:hypothetical protein
VAMALRKTDPEAMAKAAEIKAPIGGVGGVDGGLGHSPAVLPTGTNPIAR